MFWLTVKFQEDKKNIMLEFRGSENQRVIDVKKTLETGESCITEIVKIGRAEKSGRHIFAMI